jgi:alpha-L-rhamnosidase
MAVRITTHGLNKPDWDKTGFNDSKWKKALLVKVPTGRLIADPDYPVAIMDTFKVKSITQAFLINYYV